MLVGVGGRVTNLVHYILASLILQNDDTGSTVNEGLCLMTVFWMIFVRLDAVKSVRCFVLKADAFATPRAWPVYFLGVDVGVMVFTAGITKWTGPFWFNGIGFFQTSSLPWIKPDRVSSVLDVKWLMYAMNYVALIFETAFIPLFLFRKTRPISLVLLVAFFG